MPTKPLTLLPIGIVRRKYVTQGIVLLLAAFMVFTDYQRRQTLLMLEQNQLNQVSQDILLSVQSALQRSLIQQSPEPFIVDQIPMVLPDWLRTKRIRAYRQDGTYYEAGLGNPAQNYLVTEDDTDYAAEPARAQSNHALRYYFAKRLPPNPSYWQSDDGELMMRIMLHQTDTRSPLLLELVLIPSNILEQTNIAHTELAYLTSDPGQPARWRVATAWTPPWSSLMLSISAWVFWVWVNQRRALYYLPTRADIKQLQKTLCQELNILVFQTSQHSKILWVEGRAPTQLEFLAFKKGDSVTTKLTPYPQYLAHWRRALNGEKTTFEISQSDDHLRVFLWPVITEQKRLKGVNVVVQDVSEQHQLAWQLQQQQLHDPSTGLPNRQYLSEQLAHDIQTAERRGEKLAVLAVELNGLSYLLEQTNAETCENYLKQIVRAWHHQLNEEQTIARASFNEFLIVIYNYSTQQELDSIAEKLMQAVIQLPSKSQHTLAIKLNIGLTTYPHDALEANSLIGNAMITKGQASKKGNNQTAYYCPNSTQADIEKWQLEKKLAHALNHDEFELKYQPIVNVQTNQCIAAETLIRWPTTHLRPDQFIPVTEECGLIHPIGLWVLNKALKDFREWKERYDIQYISVNISAKQLTSASFFSELDRLLEKHAIGSGDLLLEITESAMLHQEQGIIEQLRELRQRGIELAIDDFGTGYSSLNYLKNLPVNTIKIDRSFIPSSDKDQNNIAICDAIIQLAQALHLKLIAEGVESPDQIKWLAEKGVTIVQGYYYSKPIKKAEFQHLLKETSS